MSGHLDELYFNWLYRQVASPRIRVRARTHWTLLRLFHQKEFVWLVPNDDNRVSDGKALRYEFLSETGVPVDSVSRDWLALGCSVLEMLVVVARIAAFETDEEVPEWFWLMVENLGLRQFTDSMIREEDYDHINDVLDVMIWRRYHHDGRGGLFPLEEPHDDQTKVEIWYQLCNYILEVSDI